MAEKMHINFTSAKISQLQKSMPSCIVAYIYQNNTEMIDIVFLTYLLLLSK